MMVYTLPEPVWPYANIVTEKPSMQLVTSGFNSLKTCN